jgi:hypothetical protein
MGLISLIIFSAPFAVALFLSWSPELGPYRKSGLNPLLLFAAFTVIFALDFMSMSTLGWGKIAGQPVTISFSHITLLEIKLACMLMAALGGIATVFLYVPAPPPKAAVAKPVDMRYFCLAVYLFILVGWYLSFGAIGVDVSSLADTVRAKAAGKGEIFLFLFSLLLLTSLSYALARQSLRVSVPLVLFSIGVLMLSGSRSRILYVLIPFAFYLFRVRRFPMPRTTFAVGIVVLGVLALVAVNFRTLVSDRQSVTFQKLISTSDLLQKNDISYAESNVLLSRIPAGQFADYLGQDIVGFFLADIPRSIAPFKPDTASRQFTAVVDRVHLARFNRELTIGTPSEIEYAYPYPLALVVIYLLGAIWAWAFRRATRSRSIHGFAWTICLYICVFVFFRNDLQKIGQVVSAFVLYWAPVEAYRQLKRRIVVSPPARKPGLPHSGTRPVPLVQVPN